MDNSVKFTWAKELGYTGEAKTARNMEAIENFILQARDDVINKEVVDTTPSATEPASKLHKQTGRIIARIRKASVPSEKTKIWQSLDLPRDELEKIVRDMVLSLPAGHYKLHSREYGTNIVDTMYDIYGWMPSMLVNEPMMLGLQALYPKKVYASFTLGLDAIEIKS